MTINDPRDISGLKLWLSAEAETGYSDNQNLPVWLDQSGNGNNTDTLTVNYPKWRSASGPSSAECVEFTASNQSFTLPDLMNSETEGEIFAWARSTAGGSEHGFWKFGTAGTNNHFPYADNLVYDDFGSNSRKDSIGVGVGASSITSWCKVNTWSKSSDWVMQVNGSTVKTDTGNTVAWNSAPKVGSHSAGGAYVAYSCIVLFDRKLTTGERADMIAWMAANPGGGVPVTPTPPDDPTGLDVDEDVTSLTLTWDASTGSPDGYDVRIDGGTPVDVGNVLTHTFTGLDPETAYTLEVRGYNANGDSGWSSIGGTTLELPAPTGLAILGADEDTLTLGWDTHAYAEGFEVRIDGGAPEDVGLTTLHMWDFLDDLTMYELEVRAYLDGFYSDWSSLDGTTGEPPPPAGEYTVTLKVGSHEWIITHEDVLDVDATVQVLDGLKIGWDLNESDPWPTQPQPVSAEVGFYALDVAELDEDLAIGTPMYAVLEDGDGNVFATFHGRLTEAVATPIKRRAGLRMLYTIKGDDYTVDLDEEPVTIPDAWPAESADDRMSRIVALAATVGITLVAPADTGTAAFEELGATTTTIGELVREHLRQIVADESRYVVVPVMDGDGLLDRFECALLSDEVDAGILPGTFAIVDGLLTIVFPDPEADGVVDAGDVNLDTSWTRLKFRAFNRVLVTGTDFAVEANRPGPPVQLALSTTLTDTDAAQAMAELYLPDTDEALGWVADRFLFYAHRHQAGLLPSWFADHRDDPPDLTPYVMPLVMLRVPTNINLAGTTALAGQLSKAALRIQRRKVEVEFALRRNLPAMSGEDGASWEWAYDTFPTVAWEDIDPELSWYEARLGKAV